MFSLLATTAAVIFCFVTVLFVLSILLQRNDIADIAWGTGIFLVAITSYILTAEKTLLSTTLLVLAGLWGVRLTLRIFLRNIKKGEDPRYKKWRDTWTWFYLRSYFQVYLFQGFLMILVGYSFIHAATFGAGHIPGPLFFLGVAVWVLGYFFEVVGDYQLDRFLKNKNPGDIMQTGLWRYTRHPNYFGEVTMWWGIFLAVATLPLAFVALISPLTITYLILKVSGIPMLEKAFDDNPKFQAYKRRTSAFFPLPPKDA